MENCPDLWAESLDLETFHMTIHDLYSGPEMTSQLRGMMTANQERIREIFRQARAYFEMHPEQALIKVKQNSIFPNLNISLLMGLKPATDRDFRILMNFYNPLILPQWPTLRVA